MDTILKSVPASLFHFLLVTLFSLLIGLSQRKLHPLNDDSRLFGTDRTFTFIGILGFILYIIDPETLMLYSGGGLILALLLGINYFFKISHLKDFGLTTIIIALITYCMAPLVITQPAWLYILVVVTVLVFTELKETFISLSTKFDKEEFITLAKFLVMAGIVLPIVPNTPFMEGIALTPYKIWLAVVVISSISYLSYLLKKFVFKDSGIILSGILGGMYSSTAATIIMARKSKETHGNDNNYAAAIIFATATMYVRILILILIFNRELFNMVAPAFGIMALVSVATGIGVYFYRRRQEHPAQISLLQDRNPLEFKVALIFTVLFISFTFITYYAVQYFGTDGLNALSFIVGVTDIDPFLINLFQGKFGVSTQVIATATFQAIISNNLLKMIYGVVLSDKKIRFSVIAGFLIITAVNILLVFVF